MFTVYVYVYVRTETAAVNVRVLFRAIRGAVAQRSVFVAKRSNTLANKLRIQSLFAVYVSYTLVVIRWNIGKSRRQPPLHTYLSTVYELLFGLEFEHRVTTRNADAVIHSIMNYMNRC